MINIENIYYIKNDIKKLKLKNEVELSTFVYMPYFFVLAISLFIIFLGLATGIMPAFRAAKIHALDALRYE
jgi:ABC-type antimicrobial peptide transport system permease subunit